MRVIAGLFCVHAVLGCVMAADLGEEITSDSEKRLLVSQMLDKYKANSGAIRTWTGKVELEQVLEKVHEGTKKTTKATVTFWSDEIARSNRTLREVHEQFVVDRNGDKTNLVRRTDSVLLKDNETYSFPTWFHPDAPDKRYLRQLLVGQDMADIGKKVFFFPALGSMDDSAYMGYLVDAYFPSTLELSKEALAEIPMWREGNTVTIVDKLEENGSLVLANKRVFDLDRAANQIRFEYEAPCIDKTEEWECQYQQVDGIWIPMQTESTMKANQQGLLMYKKERWRDQILNEEVAKELSPTTLGACRGDQAFNHKTDTLYLIEDEAYPVYQDRKEPRQTEHPSGSDQNSRE